MDLPILLFDLAILAAGDCRHDTFDQPITGGMLGSASLGGPGFNRL